MFISEMRETSWVLERELFLNEDSDFGEGLAISQAGRVAGRAVPWQGVCLPLTAATSFAYRAQQGSILQL